MTRDLLRRALHDRRAFLAAFTAGAGAAVIRPAARRDDPDDLEAAARLLGLEFDEAERKLAAGRLAMQRRAFAQLREHELARATPPALRFSPQPIGVPPPGERGLAVAWAPLPDVPKIESDDDLAFATVEELATLLRAGKTTATALTKLSLARLKAHDDKLLCVVTLLEDSALAAATKADAEIAAGNWRGPLHGIPFGAKDLFAAPGAPTTFGAEPFRDQVLDVEATVLARLREAGAILVAKLSLGALAMGDVWFKGMTRNPWKPEQGSSGSSAGSAAAVAAGLVPFALGTETLGSIVSPCSRCGVTGLRPTFGAISRHGAMPLSWSMDKIGPIARSAADCALVFDAIRGADGHDPEAHDAPFPWQRARPLEGLRIGLVGGLDGPREKAVLDALSAAGAKLQPLELPPYPYQAMLLVLYVEAAAAFDELTRNGGLAQLSAQEEGSWPNTFRSARVIPGVEYVRAQRLRTALIEDMAKVMADVDVFVAPPFGGPTLVCTNLTGHPAVVVPHGARDDGTRTTITFVAGCHQEHLALAVAEHWQRTTAWHRDRPPA
jgi:Asp-tRNA(Asn)/Glu-tRNA(Gln) amidotransferase A subunit family amidase